MSPRWKLVSILLCCVAGVGSQFSQSLASVSPLRSAAAVTDIIGLEGHQASLPCDTVPPPGDSTLIVLWYRAGSDAPVYSYDFRNREEASRRWHNATVFGSRVDFVPGRRPAMLTLRDLGPSDQSLYKCRVDFQHSRTRNALVNLIVVTSPEYVRIVNPRGRILETVAGTFSEGDRLELICRVKGGSPRPTVTWKSSEGVLPAPSQPQGEYTVSRYMVDSLTRGDLHRMLTCLASNTNLTAPSTSSVMIDMNFAPLSVSILGKGEPLSAGRRYPLVCQCVGSRPPAAITWFLGSSRMATAPGATIHRGNVTMTTLNFTPRPEDHEKVLFCRCENPVILAPILEDSWQLIVHYAPRITLTLGSSLDLTRIKEGDDVYFECSIKANPPVYKKQWSHNNRVLRHSLEDNIIISNYSLVLQDVQRSSSGVYMCVGSNVEGDADSSPVFLDVKFSPICRPGSQHIYGVSKRERAAILCDVTANPAGVRFLWTFNNTSEWRELDSRLVNSSETRSTLRYRPRTEMDYGTVFCWATNDIGRMARPCVFHIIAAGPPDPLFNCTIANRTATGVTVQCLEAFDGGLMQHFLLAVFSHDDQLVYNKTSSRPKWHVEGLIPSQRYRIQALSQNDKGRSATVTIPVDAVTGPKTHVDVDKMQDFTLAEMLPEPAARSPLLAIVLGGVSSLVLLLLAAVLVTLTRRRGRRQRSLLAPRSTAAAPDTALGPDILPGPSGASLQVYRIPPDIPALPVGAQRPASAGQNSRRVGDIPLRVFLPHSHGIYHHHHHQQQQTPRPGAAPSVAPCFSATLPPLHRRMLPTEWTQSACATLDRRRVLWPPPPRLEVNQPPDNTQSSLIGGRPDNNALIGYSPGGGTLIGCGANESAL